jgi:PTS system mannose-specific IIA component
MNRRDLLFRKRADLFFWLSIIWLVGLCGAAGWVFLRLPHRRQREHRSTSLNTEFPMIGIVLVTHGRLADEFRAALEHVTGSQKQIEAIAIGAEDDIDLCRRDIIGAIDRVDTGEGVVILTDMFGGTPSNLAISCMSRPNVDVLAGINLPVLVKFAEVREDRSLSEAIAMAQKAGRKYVTIIKPILLANEITTDLPKTRLGEASH